MRYCPVSSLTTARTFSIRTGLAASTVTPGSTPPDASLTTPVMAPCAKAAAGRSSTIARTAADRRANAHIGTLLTWGRLHRRVVCAEIRDGKREVSLFPHSPASAGPGKAVEMDA